MTDSSNRPPNHSSFKLDEKLQIEIDEIIQFKGKSGFTAELSAGNEINTDFLEPTDNLVKSISKMDPYMAGHTKRVVTICESIAPYLQLTSEEKENLKIAALLHDIGKIGIEEKILAKEDRLTEEEYKVIQQHPLIGVEIIGDNEHLKDVIPGMCYHHERTDGSGYPEGLKDASIPLIAKIIAVADAYDAMTTNRPYQGALDTTEAIAELERCTGVQFDKQVVTAFIQAYDNGEIVTDE